MNTIRRIVVILLILMLSSMVISAQDDNGSTSPDGCAIDLSSAASLIVQAQAEASAGQGEDAFRTMTLARSVLDDAIERCGGDPNMMQDAMGIVLEETYEAPAGTFGFSYPDGWAFELVETMGSGGIVYIADTPGTLDALTDSDPMLESGEQGAAIIIAGPDDLGAGALEAGSTLDDVIDEFRASIEDSPDDNTLTPTEQFAVNDFPAMRFEIVGENFDGIFIAIDRAESQQFGILLFIVASGELDAARPLVDAIAQSMTFAQ